LPSALLTMIAAPSIVGRRRSIPRPCLHATSSICVCADKSIPHMGYLSADFRETLQREVPRTPLPRTRVNRVRRRAGVRLRQDSGPLKGLPGYPNGYPITPSCCIMPKSSNLPQCSTTFPSVMRRMSIPVIVTRLPVGAMPTNSPWWVPLTLT
jgi:hypothetical protein